MIRTRLAPIVVAAVAALALSASPALAQEHWAFVGGALGDNESGMRGYDIKRIAGAPHVAYTNLENGVAKLRVVRLENGHWVPVGPAVNHNPAKGASQPSLAAGPGNVPWVSWIEPNSVGRRVLRAARYSAAQDRWVEPVGGEHPIIPPPPPGYENETFLHSAVQHKIVFLGGRAHVVYRYEGGSDYLDAVSRLSIDGTSWERFDGPGQVPYGITAHVTGGALYVAVTEVIGGALVYRWKPDGSWEQVGGPPSDSVEPGSLRPVSALTDVAGTLHALWNSSEARVARFVSGAWQDVGGPANPQGGNTIRLIGGRLYVASFADPMHVTRLNAAGTGWEETAPPAGDRAVRGGILTGINGVPYLAAADVIGIHPVRVMRLEGTTHTGADDFDDSEPPSSTPDSPPGGGNGDGNGNGNGNGDGDDDDPPPPPAGPCASRLLGTARRDTLTGDAFGNTIRGLAGNDLLSGLGGDDCLFGGPGNDRLKGGLGVDLLNGGAGNDTLTSGAGNDRVEAGSGNDVVDSRGSGFDRIDCGPGRDRALVGDLDRVRNCERVINAD